MYYVYMLSTLIILSGIDEQLHTANGRYQGSCWCPYLYILLFVTMFLIIRGITVVISCHMFCQFQYTYIYLYFYLMIILFLEGALFIVFNSWSITFYMSVWIVNSQRIVTLYNISFNFWYKLTQKPLPNVAMT